MNILKIENLNFQYEAALEKDALQNINITVAKGECVVLTGESGCGKTTLTPALTG